MDTMRKAMFFSVLSLLIILLFYASTELLLKSDEQETRLETTRVKISSISNIVASFDEHYLDSLLYVSAKNALIGLSRFYTETGNPYLGEKELHEALNTTMIEGMFYEDDGTPHNLTREGCRDAFANVPCMHKEYTVNSLKKNLTTSMRQTGIVFRKLTLNLYPGSVSQRDPWHINVTAFIEYEISDEQNIAKWKGKTYRSVLVSVYGLYDPEYNDVITSDWVTRPFEASSVKVKLERDNPPPNNLGVSPV